MTAVRDNKKPPTEPPLSYHLYTWRRMMGIGDELPDVSLETIQQDLEFNRLEKQYMNKPQEQPTPSKQIGAMNARSR